MRLPSRYRPCSSWLLLLLVALSAADGRAQTVSGASLAAELATLSGAANTVFVGQIVCVERKGGLVETTFHVEQPVRGAAGDTFVLREWAGLWAPGQNRYLPGARVLAFFHAPRVGGVTSPVHGAEGLVPVVVQGARAPRLLDIRRLAATVARAPGTPLPTSAEGAIPLADALAVVAGHAPAGEFRSLALPTRGQPPTGLLYQAEQVGFAPVTGAPPAGRPVLQRSLERAGHAQP